MFPNVITCCTRCTNGVPLWDSLPNCSVLNTTVEAVLVMLGGMLDSELLQPLTNAEAIRAHVADNQKVINKRAADASDFAVYLHTMSKRFRPEANA